MEKNEKEEQGNPMKEFNSRYIYLYKLCYLEIYFNKYKIKTSKFSYY